MAFHLNQISREAPVLIAGPTASGKSAMAMELAARDSRIIVNADALQVYSCWRILSARPSSADEAALPHRLYGHIRCNQTYSVGHWLREVQNVLQSSVVIVGGTGLYFSALTEGLAQIPDTSAEIRKLADERRRIEGFASLLAELDPATAARIDRANPARVQRAWEVLAATGRGLAAWQDTTGPAALPLKGVEALVIRPDVTWLDRRIEHRFKKMLEEGALEEVALSLPDWDPARASSKAIGAPELIAHLRGELTLTEATEAATLASRKYAKRQRTWFRSRMKLWREIALP